MWAWILGLGLAAWAQTPSVSYYLETAPLTSRGAATEVLRTARREGVGGRVVRVYLEGEGWRWVFRSRPSDDLSALSLEAEALRGPLDETLLVVMDDEGVQRPVPDAGASVQPTPSVSSPAELVERMMRHHAGPDPVASPPESVLFRFTRARGRQRIGHTYARRGDDRFLSVEVEQGPGRSSEAGLVGGRAWSDVQGAEQPPPHTTRVQLDRFSPERVLSHAWDLLRGHLDTREWLGLAVHEVRDAGATVELRWEGSRSAAPGRLVLSRADGELRAFGLGVDGAETLWTYEGWTELPTGALRPTVVEVSQGARVIDRIEVEALDLAPVLPADWFARDRP